VPLTKDEARGKSDIVEVESADCASSATRRRRPLAVADAVDEAAVGTIRAKGAEDEPEEMGATDLEGETGTAALV
jgi:hypothetical protein